MADLDFGKIGLTDAGDWDANTTFGILDGVSDENSYWESLQNNNKAHKPSLSPLWWRKIINGDAIGDAATQAAAAQQAASDASDAATLANQKAAAANSAAQSANEAAEAAMAAVVTAELPAVAVETNVRNIVRNYTPSA